MIGRIRLIAMASPDQAKSASPNAPISPISLCGEWPLLAKPVQFLSEFVLHIPSTFEIWG